MEDLQEKIDKYDEEAQKVIYEVFHKLLDDKDMFQEAWQMVEEDKNKETLIERAKRRKRLYSP